MIWSDMKRLPGSGIEIEHSSGIERVAVLADDGLAVDRRQLTEMMEFTEPAVLNRDACEIHVSFGANEIVDGNGDAGLRIGGRCEAERDDGGETDGANGHDLSPDCR